jgi:hypothetical protein
MRQQEFKSPMSHMELKDVQLNSNDVSHPYILSLVKLTGLQIVDIEVSVTRELGDCTVEVKRIVFSDGSSRDLGGAHDLAFIEDQLPNLNQDILESLYNQSNKALDDYFEMKRKERGMMREVKNVSQ